MKLKKALLVVDVQNDFCPGGKLAVAHGDQIIIKARDSRDAVGEMTSGGAKALTLDTFHA